MRCRVGDRFHGKRVAEESRPGFCGCWLQVPRADASNCHEQGIPGDFGASRGSICSHKVASRLVHPFRTRRSIMSQWTRRKVLKGMLQGSAVTVALPLLDCFLDGNGQALASGAPIPTRFGTWFWPCGINEKRFFPTKTGTDFEMNEETSPLTPFKKKVTIFSGFDVLLSGTSNFWHCSGT